MRTDHVCWHTLRLHHVCQTTRVFTSMSLYATSVGIRLVLFRSSSTHTYIYMYMYTYNRCSNKVSDIQGSICRISSQACAGESSRSGTANVLRNALIWKSRSSTLLYEKPSPQIQTPYCTTMALVDTTAQDSGENLSARLSQSC